MIPRLQTIVACATSEGADLIGPRNELDSHANMVVVDQDCTIFDNTGLTCTINAFTKSSGKLEEVHIVDTVVAYDCPFQANIFLLLMRNALYVPEIHFNLLLPFIV